MFTNFESAQLRQEALSAGLAAIVSKDKSIAALASSIQSLLEPVSLDRACKSPRNTFRPTSASLIACLSSGCTPVIYLQVMKSGGILKSLMG
jgi:DNA-binding NarL/FixJ family response regulator